MRNTFLFCLVLSVALFTACTKQPQPPADDLLMEEGFAVSPGVEEERGAGTSLVQPTAGSPTEKEIITRLKETFRVELAPGDYFKTGIQFLEEGEADKARAALGLELERRPQNQQATELLQQLDADPEEVLANGYSEYVIQADETLSRIAQQFLGDPLKFYILAKINNIEKARNIFAGQKIKIPKTDIASRAPEVAQAAATPASPTQAPAPRASPTQAPAPQIPTTQASSPQETIPPRITLLQPIALQETTRMTTAAAELKLVGVVTDDSRVERLTLNDTDVSRDSQGYFQHTLRLTAPTTVLTLVARDAHGNRKTVAYTITREKPGSPVATLPDIDFGRYHALVIGNNVYAHHPRLEAAVPDANAVAELLTERYGFHVTRLRNATREEIIIALDELRGALTPQDNLLIYYAGHGVIDPASGQGYWLPVDAQEDNRAYWISITDITDTLRAMTARHVMVVADSCYSGRLTRSTPAGLPPPGQERHVYLSEMVQKRSRTALTSGGLEPVPDRRHGGKHSVFAAELLRVLRENTDVLEGQQVFSIMRPRVVVNAPNTPEYSNIRFTGHDGGDFFFIPRKTQ